MITLKDIKIIDNFLPDEEYQKMHDFVFNGQIPLFYQYNTLPFEYSYDYKMPEGIEELDKKFGITKTGHPFFTHMLFDDYRTKSEWGDMYKPVLEKLKPLALIRGKLNVNNNTCVPISSGWHYDLDTEERYRTFIYHLNTNNGYTLFSDGSKAKSVANRLITFPGKYEHTGITHTDEPTRAFITFNYIE
jgi:hypothetical protein